MMDQNFGHKELYEVVLRAKNPMQFGDRYIEADEPVLYFDDINMSLLSEQNRPVFARGGWANMPRVIWDDRSEVQFQMVDGVLSSMGMSMLLAANVMSQKDRETLYIHMKEGPFIANTYEKEIDGETKIVPYVNLKYKPIFYPQKKIFIFDYRRSSIQQKLYGLYAPVTDPFDATQVIDRLEIYQDKNCKTPAEINGEYVIDYYYKYEDEALIYSVKKERFNTLFTLEAKFYSKDENEGQNYTNVLYMPKVRIVSNINLRLGERADPTVSTFNIIGLPETVGDQKSLIMEITRLSSDIDAEI